MDIKVHNQILWRACLQAAKAGGLEKDPREYFPLLVRGSWMNDTNQTSIFTNKLEQLTNDEVEDEVQRFFCAFWNADKDALLEKMNDGPQAARDAHANARHWLDTIPGDRTDDFGTYHRYDHMDIATKEEAAAEHDFWQDDHLKRCKTIAKTVGYVKNRLNTNATIAPGDRFGWAEMTAFGKALHAVEDFYAHSNFVELMLWSLARRGLIGQRLVDEFNGPVDFLKPAPYQHVYCPLPPADPVETQKMTMHNIMFWYNESPQATPLVSTLFDATDTMVSLLDLYAANLEKLDSAGHDKKLVDFLLAVIQVPGEALVGFAWNIASAFSALFENLGKAAREWLADELVAKSQDLDPTAQSFIEVGAGLLRNYDSAAAKDWARAGRLRYLSWELQKSLASEMDEDNRHGKTFLLPHHSLLRKDYYPKRFDDVIRFRMACALATDLTAELIRWYFSPDPTDPEAARILDGAIRHPWLMLPENDDNDPACQKMKKTAELCAGSSWTRLFD